MEANQNSNSPKDFTDTRLTPVMTVSSTADSIHWSRSIQLPRMAAPATASAPTRIT
ncbi:hypothetical protein B7C42_08352 [Nocardia cerradoensis]|uniref:Uncharacterized protein n=1 Tax=Nocardia cerradoensis TaxID=85688 RepID=A0A231GSI5_9NOCA|nr:hypothetical protein B7C42_08352 [Nocardia cerradoensis]